MIGREETVKALVARVSRQRLVTIVGPGGTGKTTVALAVAEQLIAGYEHGVWLVDLTPLGDQRLVPSTVATVLGFEIRADDQLSGLVTRLKDKRMLLLLDNCEHVIDAAACLTAEILSRAPGVSILATSRERIGIIGEREYRLGPLGSPEPSSKRTIAETATFPAVQLFVERVSAIVEDFELTDANAPLIIEICRKLDGLPLAIEFAAPCVEALGVQGLADHLNDNLPMLTAQRRTSTARHHTMRAVIDWSYGLLSDNVQRNFRALGIFAGSFTADAATTVAMDAETTSIDAMDRLADLVAKSLVVADVGGTKPRFRLLDTTRAYAREKLTESGEAEQIARNHAAYFRDLFMQAASETQLPVPARGAVRHGQEIDNVRAALDWAFSAAGGTSIGIDLTAAYVPQWTQLSLFGECRTRIETALAVLDRGSGHAPRTEMILRAALGTSLAYTRGPVDEADANWQRVFELAKRLDDTEYQMRALYGRCMHKTLVCDHRAALTLAWQFRRVAERVATATDVATSDRIMALVLHYLGDQTAARACAERSLAGPIPPNRHVYSTRYGIDQRVGALVQLARTLWLQGFPEQAMQAARASVDEAVDVGHGNSICLALADGACIVAMLSGKLDDAEHFAGMLTEHAEGHDLGVWRIYGRAVRGRLLAWRGHGADGAALLRSALADLRKTPLDMRFQLYLVWLAEVVGAAGQVTEALAAIDEALERAERTEERWYIPELLRLRGELRLQDAEAGDTADVRDMFAESLRLARSQDVLSWELRTTMSLVRLRRGRAGAAGSRAILASVLARFSEGFGTADLVAARRLLVDRAS
jgi:predicted ATPase